MAFPIVAAGIGAASSILGGLIGSTAAGRQARAARAEVNRQGRVIASLKAQRPEVTDPYAGYEDLSDMAKDLSSMMSNPYQNLGVATQAAEIQMEQSDLALANTLDTLAATGASAGGATALAQAALQSKKGVSASIEAQEAQNEKLKAQGEQQLQQLRVSEQQRLQQIGISEGQRLQQAEAAGQQFMFQAQENRINMDMNRAAGLQDRAMQMEAQANMSQASAIGGMISGLGSLASAGIGYAGQVDAAIEAAKG